MGRYDGTSNPMARRVSVGVMWMCVVFALLGGSFVGNSLRHVAVHPLSPTIARSIIKPPQLPPPAKPFTFPDGGRTLATTYRVVALYGSPTYPALGALGEQSLPDAITRVKQLADQYTPLSTAPILPAFEIIATVASATPTENNDYSAETDPAHLQPWIAAAQAAGVYVILDLQPGRTDFLTQAKEYAPLLAQPNVGLALDPEWRLAPDQVPLAQIGSVDISEVNSVVVWLAALTHADHLPQKLFILHQFRLSMLSNRTQLDTSHPELAYIIQMDGQGSQPEKQATWQTITAEPPTNVNFGWKNFYEKDAPMLDPAATLQVSPEPWYISYQ